MLSADVVQRYVERLMADGVTDMDEIEDSVYRAFRGEVDTEGAIRDQCKRRASLAVLKMRNADGDRLAFTVRDADGVRRVGHVDHTKTPDFWLAVSQKYDRKSRRAAIIAGRAYNLAVQLGLFDSAA